jgi:hypothetical protein
MSTWSRGRGRPRWLKGQPRRCREVHTRLRLTPTSTIAPPSSAAVPRRRYRCTNRIGSVSSLDTTASTKKSSEEARQGARRFESKRKNVAMAVRYSSKGLLQTSHRLTGANRRDVTGDEAAPDPIQRRAVPPKLRIDRPLRLRYYSRDSRKTDRPIRDEARSGAGCGRCRRRRKFVKRQRDMRGPSGPAASMIIRYPSSEQEGTR